MNSLYEDDPKNRQSISKSFSPFGAAKIQTNYLQNQTFFYIFFQRLLPNHPQKLSPALPLFRSGRKGTPFFIPAKLFEKNVF
jgi:hypothetical protein